MRRVVVRKPGDLNALQFEDLPTPEPGPERFDPYQASGVNYADLMARMGLYQDAPPCPMGLGYEVSGQIEALGDGVDEAWLGQDVLSLTQFNGYATHVVLLWIG